MCVYSIIKKIIMKREFLLLIALTMVMLCRAQQAIHLSNGATLAIHNNTELTLLGGITLEEGSSLNNNGTLRLKNNPVTNLSNWIDNSLTGAISGTGLVIFNSANPHSFAGFSSFYSLQLNAAGLLLNNHLSVSNQLHLINGKINTGTNHIFLNNSDASSFLNDVSNNGYANSWINGNFRRMITANTSTYDFPVGNDTKCNLLQFLNNNITGTTQLTASFGPKPGTDDGLNVSEGEDQYVSVNDNGVWHLNPDAAASGGNHALQLFSMVSPVLPITSLACCTGLMPATMQQIGLCQREVRWRRRVAQEEKLVMAMQGVSIFLNSANGVLGSSGFPSYLVRGFRW